VQVRADFSAFGPGKLDRPATLLAAGSWAAHQHTAQPAVAKARQNPELETLSIISVISLFDTG